jgi:hypothetical protein
MCNECFIKEFNYFHGKLVQRIQRFNKSHYHCLTEPARLFIYNDNFGSSFADVEKGWFINGIEVKVSSQEELKNSNEYRIWKMRAFH